MKLVVIVLLVATCHAIDLQSQNIKDDNTEKREISRGNSMVDKRAPAISTVSPAITPGIEYANSKESQHDKSPTHQVYASPLPPVSKISDVLTGHGPGFQSAIASHLYAPVSVYQSRLGSPTTYEVSAPVPSNLAYAEHRVSLQPIQNAIQLNQKPLQKSKNAQQILVQQPVSYPQEFGPIAQHVYPQISQVQYQDFPINQFQVPLYSGQQTLYQDQQIQVVPSAQPATVYSSESQQVNHQQTQKDLKPQPGSKTAEKQIANQNYVQPKGAVSFTKFSQLQPTPALQPQQEIQYQPQPQPQLQPQLQPQPQAQPLLHYQQSQAQYQQQLPYQPHQPQFQLLQQPQIQYQPYQQYQVLPQIQPFHYQLQPEQAQPQSQPQQQIQPQQYSQPQQQSQPQIQYQSQPQLKQQLLLAQPQHQVLPAPQQQHQPLPQPQYQPIPHQQIHLQPISKASNVGKVSYLRPGSVFLQSQYPQSHETPDYRSNVALPTFPPVQYFGKYAQSIFGNLPH